MPTDRTRNPNTTRQETAPANPDANATRPIEAEVATAVLSPTRDITQFAPNLPDGILIGDPALIETDAVDWGMVSPNFVAGSSGWRVRSNGDAEFGNVTARGLIQGATILSTDGMNMITNPTCAVDTTDWSATTNCTIARNAAFAHPSTATTTALQITAAAAGIATATSGFMVMDTYAGMAHGVSANWQETSGVVNAPNTLSLIIDWYDINQALISSSAAEVAVLVSGVSYRAVFPGTQAPSYSPAGSKYFKLRLVINTANNSSTVVNVTDIQVAMIGSVAARVGTFERLFVVNPGSGITTATIDGGTTDASPLLLECAAQTMTQVLTNNTASNVLNNIRLDFSLKTSVGLQTALRIQALFTDVTDATRTSSIVLSTAQSGVFSDVMAFVGTNVGIGTLSPKARAHIWGDFLDTVTKPTVLISTNATNDDPSQYIYQSRVTTADATITTLTSLNMSTFVLGTANFAFAFQSFVTGRCTSALASSCTYSITGGGTYNNGTSTVAMLGTPTVLAYEGNAATDATADGSGTNFRVRVTGLAANNFSWHCTTFIFPCSQ